VLCLLTAPSALPFSCAAVCTWNTSQEPVHYVVKTIDEIVLPELKYTSGGGKIIFKNNVAYIR